MKLGTSWVTTYNVYTRHPTDSSKGDLIVFQTSSWILVFKRQRLYLVVCDYSLLRCGPAQVIHTYVTTSVALVPSSFLLLLVRHLLLLVRHLLLLAWHTVTPQETFHSKSRSQPPDDSYWPIDHRKKNCVQFLQFHAPHFPTSITLHPLHP